MKVLTIKPVVDNDSPLGSWGLIAEGCPMHVHQDAIGAKREECMNGIQTNMQGAIPLGSCKHAKGFAHDKHEVQCGFAAQGDIPETPPCG